MKRINLLILLPIIAANTCVAMANNAKINPAVAVAASKLQAKPVLFLNVEKTRVSRNMETGVILDGISAYKSLELIDLDQKWWEGYQDYRKKSEKLTDHSQQHPLCDQINAFSLNNGQLQNDVFLKMNVIAEKIAKRLGASVVIKYDVSPRNPYGLYAYIDPTYDITDEVFDTLNKEYKASKGEKSKCNHSCYIHCPHKH